MKRFVWLAMTSLLILSGCSSDDSNMIVGTPHEGDDDQVDVPGTPQKDGTDPDKTDPDKYKPGDNPQNQPEDPENPPSEHPDNPPVEPDPNACELTQCGDAEVCLLTDKANCGECGHACLGDDASCVDGACVNECTGLMCGGSCIDPMIDHDNCGQCGEQCGESDDCIEGSCKPHCDGTRCGDECIDTTNDPNHCGGCDIICGEHQICSDSKCICEPGLTECEGACVDLKTDIANCGACGTTCEASCKDATCAPLDDQEVVDFARQYLFDNTHMCTYDLKDQIEYFADFAWRKEDFNYGYDKNCANFVAAILKATGRLTPVTKDYTSVKLLDQHCKEGGDGYHILDDPTKARAGDIWYTNTLTHAEIVVGFDEEHPNQIKLIGSNNYNTKDKVECLQNHSTNSKLSSDPTDYQRVTEQYRKIETGTVCSRFY